MYNIREEVPPIAPFRDCGYDSLMKPSKIKKSISSKKRLVYCSAAILLCLVFASAWAANYFSDTLGTRAARYAYEVSICGKPNVVPDRGGAFKYDFSKKIIPTDPSYNSTLAIALKPHTKYLITCSSEQDESGSPVQ